jgi:hypothetical protein
MKRQAGGGAGDPLDYSDRYNTKLSDADEQAYQKWAKQNGRENDTYDYDMRGAWLAGAKAGDNGHFPDTYKKPNHPTFSTESIYNGNGNYGGSWGDNSFTPGTTNLMLHSVPELQDYFQRVEPGSSLNTNAPVYRRGGRTNVARALAIARQKRKASKQSVHYSRGMKSKHCGICQHFRPPHSCELVEGKIDPEYWCEKFKAKPAK